MIDMPERLEMIRYFTALLDQERNHQPHRLAHAELQQNQEAGIVVLFRRPRRVEVILPIAWLTSRNASFPLGMAMGGFKLALLLRDLSQIPADLPAPAIVDEEEEPVEVTETHRDRGMEMALRALHPSNGPHSTKDIVAAADAFARYLAGERPEQENGRGS